MCLGGGGGDGLSGAQASSIRAASRRSQLLAAFGPEQGGMGVEEGAEEGEEDYDDPEEMWVVQGWAGWAGLGWAGRPACSCSCSSRVSFVSRRCPVHTPVTRRHPPQVRQRDGGAL